MAINQYSASEEYPDLENHNSHMAHCLTEEVYKRMRAAETTSGFTIDNVIQVGVDNPGSPFSMTVGCLAGDEESYKVFAEFFDQIIEARHQGYKETDQQRQDADPSHIEYGEDLDPKYVVSCRVRGVRNIKGFCLPPHCSRAERRKVENIAVEALSKMADDFSGKYHDLKSMTTNEQEAIFSSLKFESPLSPNHLPTSMSRDWPDARGFWLNEKKNVLAKVNENDHIRLVSFQDGGNLKQAYTRWCSALEQFEGNMKQAGQDFMKDSHLGYISTCPSNLGTGIRAGVRIKLPLLSRNNRIEEVLRRLGLERKEAQNVTNATTADQLFDVSNEARLGLSEVELIQTVIDGVNFLTRCENKLENGESIDKDINHLKRK